MLQICDSLMNTGSCARNEEKPAARRAFPSEPRLRFAHAEDLPLLLAQLLHLLAEVVELRLVRGAPLVARSFHGLSQFRRADVLRADPQPDEARRQPAQHGVAQEQPERERRRQIAAAAAEDTGDDAVLDDDLKALSDAGGKCAA